MEKLKVMAVWNTINLTDIKPDRCDAEYFRKDYQDNISYLKTTGEIYNLGHLFNHINRGSQPLYSNNGSIKALRSVNVGFMNFNETRQEYVTESFFEANNRGQVQKEDILITSTGVGTLGRTSVWFYDDKAYCDGHITILRNGIVDPYFITAYLNSKYGLVQFDQNYRGSSGQIEIYPYDISKFVIPKCLFPYQQEIGDYLRKAFDLQQEAYKQKQKSSEILESELGLNHFQKDESKFRVTQLSELSDSRRFDAQSFKPEFLQYELFIRENNNHNNLFELLNRISKGNQQFISLKGDKPYVSIKDITGIDVIAKGNVANPLSKAMTEDLLLAVTGATIGKIGIVNRYPSISFSGDILGLSVNKDKISPWYLLAVLSSPIGQTQFNRWITGSTNGHLSPSDVRKIIVPRIDYLQEDKIENLLKTSLKSLAKSEELLLLAKNRVEELIEAAAKK